MTKSTTREIDGLYVIEPTVFGDTRGCFMESRGKRHGGILSAENKKRIFILEGLAHGFFVL